MTRIRLKSLLLVLIIMFVVMMVEAKVNNLRDEVFNRVWRGFMDDDTQSYKSHIFAVKINNSTNIIDIYIVKTSDYEHVIRKYPVYVHLKGDYVMKDNLTDSIDLSVFNVQCENMALPNSLADPTGCQQYSSLWTSGARYWYSLFDVDEDNQVNYYINIRNEEDKTYIMWKGPVNQVNQLASICAMSENWKLDNNDMFGRLSESGYVRFNSDGTYTQQINQAIDFGKARSVCKMQENFLSMKIKGRYQYLAELGILVATRSVCSDLQYWVQDVIDCNLCNKREQAFGLSAIVSFDSGNCASTTLQVENLSDKYAALRISRAFDPPIPKEIEAQPSQPCSNNDMELAVAISVVALVLVCVILGVIAYWMFIYFKNRRRPAYKPLE